MNTQTTSAQKKESGAPPIRLVIQQPALPKYRVPVFRELARRPGIRLKLYYGASERTIPTAQAEGFEAEYVADRAITVRGRRLTWHTPQWRYASRRYADVLLMTWGLPHLSMIPALIRARFSGVPTILWGHGYSKNEIPWRLALRLRVARLATATLFYNHSTAQRFIRMGLDPKRVFVALNCLDQEPIQRARQRWLSAPDELAEFQRRHDLLGKQTILFVSRLERANRVDLLLRAADQLRRRGRRALRIVIVGIGEDHQRLVDLTGELKLEEHVRFTGAVYDEDQLAPWFLSAQAFCYPANMGLSLLHAFGYGLPVVTSDRVESHGPEIEAFEHERNGLFYKEGNSESLAAALERLLDDRQFAARLSAEAHQTATAKFTLSKMVDGMEAAVRFCAATLT